MSLTHGRHNESLCDYLWQDANGSYDDWVVTTAFYAALHYVNHALFPREIDEVNYSSFDNYYNSLPVASRSTPHNERLHLVRQFLYPAWNAYGLLLDSSKSARYRSYRITKQEARQARVWLNMVKQHCQAP